LTGGGNDGQKKRGYEKDALHVFDNHAFIASITCQDARRI